MTHKSKTKQINHDFDRIKELSPPLYDSEEMNLNRYADHVHRERVALEHHIKRESKSKASVMMEKSR